MPKTKFLIVITILILFTFACNTLTSNPQTLPTKYVIAEPTFPPIEANLPLTEADVPRPVKHPEGFPDLQEIIVKFRFTRQSGDRFPGTPLHVLQTVFKLTPLQLPL